ncbi:uncharacterized protein EAE97_007728 [Botrytis byssoidea]|uniref:Uncharacterized protein n=1 Tax=Botrytis byssoidea TaxID=139641 RepID=A0A9P5IJR5_9HELO|nr:uncharacterized protein EAE97_007728 [Botrytis byssoidea]KAF7937932.1 hypothetical protein EAE97_007728 [Botrytis byssoidea]
MSSRRRRDLSRKGAPGEVDRKRYSRGSRSRLRDLRKGICRENIDRGTKVYKDAFDLSWDSQIEENTMVLRNMYNTEINIAEYASWSLPEFLWIQMGSNYSETMKLSEMLWKYWGENHKMFTKTPLHHLHSLRPIVVMSYTIEGLKELLYFRAGNCPIECEVMKHLNSETLSFCTTAERPSNVESVETSMFPMVKERFNNSGSANSIEAAKNPSSSNVKRDTEWYVGLSNRCQCKLGVHEWLEEFICDISAQNPRADRLKSPEHYSNYAKNIQKGKTKTPLYVISRLYLNFIAKKCFCEQTGPMGMILIQAFAMKWMHYTILPFDEDDWEFQAVMSSLSDMPIMDLTDYLEKVLRKRVDRLIERSMDR